MNHTAGLFEVGGPESSYQSGKGLFEKLQKQAENNPYLKELKERQPYGEIQSKASQIYQKTSHLAKADRVRVLSPLGGKAGLHK